MAGGGTTLNTRTLAQHVVTLVLLAFAGLAPAKAWAATVTAMVTHVVGSGEVERAGQLLNVKVGLLVKKGDRFTLSAKSAIKVTFTDGSQVTLFEKTNFTLEDMGSTAGGGLDAKLDVLKGKVRFFVKPKSVENKVRFKTAQSVMGVRGTSGIIEASETETRLFVTTGKVGIASLASVAGEAPASDVLVTAGFMSSALGGAAPRVPVKFEPQDLPLESYASPIPLDVPAGPAVQEDGAKAPEAPGESEAAPEPEPAPEQAPKREEQPEERTSAPKPAERKLVYSPESDESFVHVKDADIQILANPDAALRPADTVPDSASFGVSRVTASTTEDISKQIDETVSRVKSGASAPDSGRRKVKIRFKTEGN